MFSRGPGGHQGNSNGTVASGLKEALEVGTKNTGAQTGVTDGFFRHEAIKILLPDKLRPIEKGLRFAGRGQKVDGFVSSMNRAAEKATPAASSMFQEAITKMTFEDARKVLSGGDTAATEYVKDKISDQLRTAFRPPVKAAIDETGVVQQYKA
jgi:Protein of unknown function (DUF4197)